MKLLNRIKFTSDDFYWKIKISSKEYLISSVNGNMYDIVRTYGFRFLSWKEIKNFQFRFSKYDYDIDHNVLVCGFFKIHWGIYSEQIKIYNMCT